MAEVGADDEGVFGVFEVRGQNSSNPLLLMTVIVANQDGDNGWEVVWASKRLLKSFVYVRRVHFERVLSSVLPRGDVGEVTCLLHSLDSGLVDLEVTERRGILGEGRDSTAVQIIRVRRAQEEDSLGLAEIERAVGPGCTRSRVVETGVSTLSSNS